MQGKSSSLNAALRLFLFAFFALSGALSAFAQDGILDIHGTVKDDATNKKLEGTVVSIKQNGQEFDAITTTANGKYGFELPLGYNYVITFTIDSYVAKKVEINTKGIPPEDMAGGFQLNMDMTLFAYVEGFNTAILDQPIGKASFDPIRNAVEFDYGYTGEIQKQIQNEFKRLEKLGEEMEKMIAQFNKLIEKGDQAMTAEKYADAVSNFQQALDLIPDREPAPEKLAAAQAALDAENAARELEKRYNDLMASARSNIGKEKFEEARDALEEARDLKPEEREPKDLLAQIEKELEALEKRRLYEGIVAAADKEFDVENFAVSIEKYEEALALFSTEAYPRDQIKKARAFIDERLANAAAEEEKQRRYDEAIARADKNVEGLEYDAAINNYRAALEIKPSEKYPQDQIRKVEELIAAAQRAEQEAQASADQAAKDAIEKQYRDLIQQGDNAFNKEELEAAIEHYEGALEVKPDERYPQSRIDKINEMIAARAQQALVDNAKQAEENKTNEAYNALILSADGKFTGENWEEAKADYQAALELKPQEKYPKSRIQRIDELIAQQNAAQEDALAENRRKLEEERLAAEEADRIAREERLNRQEEDRLRRQQEEEEERERLAREQREREEAERQRLNDFANNANTSTEDEAERYYRDARIKEEQAKTKAVQDRKEQHSRFIIDRNLDAQDRVENTQAELDRKSENLEAIALEGEMNREGKVDESEKVKARNQRDQENYASQADRRQSNAISDVEREQSQLADLSREDVHRERKIDEIERKQEVYAENTAVYQSKGDAIRGSRNYDVKRDKERLVDMAREGEQIRLVNVDEKVEEKELYASYSNDLTSAAEERKALTIDKVEQKKETQKEVGAGAEERRENNEYFAERKKESASNLATDRQEEAKNRSYDERRKRFNLDAGKAKDPEDYILPAGAENIEEGVQERSYEEGNKMVIERTVKRGNKVDTYRKVISKTGIYYFKNGRSITEVAWKRETIEAQN